MFPSDDEDLDRRSIKVRAYSDGKSDSSFVFPQTIDN